MNENVVDLLYGFEPEEGRMRGNSTRLIDKAIQLLFEGKTVIVRDHHYNGKNSNKMNAMLFERIIKRIYSEHSPIIEKKRLVFNRKRLEIKIMPK